MRCLLATRKTCPSRIARSVKVYCTEREAGTCRRASRSCRGGLVRRRHAGGSDTKTGASRRRRTRSRHAFATISRRIGPVHAGSQSASGGRRRVVDHVLRLHLVVQDEGCEMVASVEPQTGQLGERLGPGQVAWRLPRRPSRSSRLCYSTAGSRRGPNSIPAKRLCTRTACVSVTLATTSHTTRARSSLGLSPAVRLTSSCVRGGKISVLPFRSASLQAQAADATVRSRERGPCDSSSASTRAARPMTSPRANTRAGRPRCRR